MNIFKLTLCALSLSAYCAAQQPPAAEDPAIAKLKADVAAMKVKQEQLQVDIAVKQAALAKLQGTQVPKPEPQDPVFDPILKSLKDLKITVRKSATDKNAIQDPATVLFTMPENGKNSYSIDAAITWDVASWLRSPSNGKGEGSDTSFEFGPVLEYHKNTQLAKPQDTLMAGAVFSGVFGDISTDAVTSILTAQAKYKRDDIAKSEGTLALLEYAPLIAGSKAFNIGGTITLGDELLVVLQPKVGLSFESSNNVAKSGHSGDTFRSKELVEALVFPFAKSLSKRLLLTSRFTAWQGFGQSGGFQSAKNSQTLFEQSISYSFGTQAEDESYPIAIGVDYVNGENPDESLLNTAFWRVGFKIKL